jgi:predicted nucleic acid-binding protein
VNPKTVIVETNWVVDIIAPAHLQDLQAIKLLTRARDGEINLFVPAICFAEARETVPRRFAPRSRSEDLRKFVRWAKSNGKVLPQDAEIALKVFDQFDGLVATELTKVSERLRELSELPYLNLFPLSETMLERQVAVGALNLSLKPFDLAIFAAVLVKAEELFAKNNEVVYFCELDSDLHPWDKSGSPKPSIKKLYDDSHIRVYENFDLP